MPTNPALHQLLVGLRQTLARESDLSRVMAAYEKLCSADQGLNKMLRAEDEPRLDAAVRSVGNIVFPDIAPVARIPNLTLKAEGYHQGMFVYPNGAVGYCYFEVTDQGFAFGVGGSFKQAHYFRFSILAEPLSAPGGSA